MSRVIDMTGRRFGRLLVLRRADNLGRRASWVCACDCGNEVVQPGADLRNGNTRSCGCLRADVLKALANRRRSQPARREMMAFLDRVIGVCDGVSGPIGELADDARAMLSRFGPTS